MRVLFISLLVCIVFNLEAQEYYLPSNVQKAYVNKTRSKTGKQGENYFQNRSVYEIQAAIDPSKGLLTGEEKIIYYNNSPDTLELLVVRLYQDIFKKGNMRDEAMPEEYINQGVLLKSIYINGMEYVDGLDIFKYQEGTNLYLTLTEPLYSMDSVRVNIKWEVQLPKGHAHRFGNYGESDWFVSLWYPQISVYDDIDGWDVWSYTGQYEFYNDFNDYKVELTVPRGHMVWATGEWMNPSEVLSDKVLDNYYKSQNSEEIIHVIREHDWLKKDVLQKAKKHIFRFQAVNVPDFTFAISDDYLWDAGTVVTDSVSAEGTVVNAVYPVDAINFELVAKAGMDAVRDFTYQSLGIKYPYAQVTVFNGDGGMEYPMMINMDNETVASNTFVAMHEIFHGYFPFYTGLNERKYAWMDEGLTTYLAIETEERINTTTIYQLPVIISAYNYFSGEDIDLPLMIPSALSRGNSYYFQAYIRSSVVYSILERYVGREDFRAAIRGFAEDWKGKHPTAFDFIFSMSNAFDEDVSWLINTWFYGYGWADLGVKDVAYANNTLKLKIENVGGLPVPIELRFFKSDGSVTTKFVKVDCWKDGDKNIEIEFGDLVGLTKIELGSPFIPDKDVSNNYYSISAN